MGAPGRPVTPCPGCGKPVGRAPVGRAAAAAAGGTAPSPDPFPFCSVRCQLVDLGRWFDEDYRIPDGDQPPADGSEGGPAPGDDGLT